MCREELPYPYNKQNMWNIGGNIFKHFLWIQEQQKTRLFDLNLKTNLCKLFPYMQEWT